jgi:DNA-directed RNA polymerase specialized sigma24 family protein
MKQRRSRSSSQEPELIKHTGQLMKTPTGASIPHFARVSPEDDEPIEELLELYSFQYILERVKQTISSFPALQHIAEEIASEVYQKFWQRLREGPVQNPPAYIGRMIHNKCIDHMRCYISEACHIVQSNSEGGMNILESDQVAADSEGLRDPAEEFEYKAALEEWYQRVTAAIAELPPRQQQATAWHLLRDADDPQFLMELFNDFHIVIPVVRLGDKNEEHLLNVSYIHARKALARRLDIDLSQFKQTKRYPSRAKLAVPYCTPSSSIAANRVSDPLLGGRAISL